jgi:FkbM family methyltransferase
MHAIYNQLLRPADLCFEVGAHRGTGALELLEYAGRLVAIEPQPWCAMEFARSMAPDDRVAAVVAAAGARPGHARLFVCRGSDTISTLSEHFRTRSRFATRGYCWDETLDTKIITLDQLIARHGRPDYCRIDAEGFEALILQGLSCPLRLVSFEFHEELPDAVSQCLVRLEALSPLMCNVEVGDSRTLALDRWVRPAELLDRLPALGPCEWGLWGQIYVRMLL